MSASTSIPEMTGAQCGRVFMREKGNFFGKGEILQDHDQLPQFFPRTNWPEDLIGKVGPPGCFNIKVKGTSYPFSHAPGYPSPEEEKAVRDQITAAYPLDKIIPMNSWKSDGSINTKEDGRYFTWVDHVGVLHNLLNDHISKREELRSGDMHILMDMVSQGMHHSVAFLPGNFGVLYAPKDAPSGKEWQTEYVPEFGRTMMKLEFDWWGETIQEVRERMLNRRWVVARTGTVERHWTMSIFDRLEGQLYIFDSGRSKMSTEGTIQPWARIWNELDMPYHFQYILPSTTSQLGIYECGHLCIQWLINTLRNRTAPPTDDWWDDQYDIDYQDFVLGEVDAGFQISKWSLPLVDWVPHTEKPLSAEASTDTVMTLLKVMICNELGLEAWFEPGSWGRASIDQVKEFADMLNENRSKIPLADFQGFYGGVQFVRPEGRENRQVYADPNTFVHLDTSYEDLRGHRGPALAQVTYPENRSGYTAEHPANGPRLRIQPVEPCHGEPSNAKKGQKFELILENMGPEFVVGRIIAQVFYQGFPTQQAIYLGDESKPAAGRASKESELRIHAIQPAQETPSKRHFALLLGTDILQPPLKVSAEAQIEGIYEEEESWETFNISKEYDIISP